MFLAASITHWLERPLREQYVVGPRLGRDVSNSGVAYVTKTLPWSLFVNQGFYIPKCLLSCVDFKNGSCHFFLFTFKVKVKAQRSWL